MKQLLILFFLLFHIGIGLSQKAANENDIKIMTPKKGIKYKLANKKFKLSDTTIISLEARYLNCNYLCGNKCDTLYNYLHFYNDGRVFFSFSYLNYPTKQEYNDTTYGKFGKYIIQNDSIITIELYQDRYTGIEFLHAKKQNMEYSFFHTVAVIQKAYLIKKIQRQDITKKYTD